MIDFTQTAASRSLENAVLDHFIPAEAPWSGIVRKGQTIRIEDSYGQQAVDTLFYRADHFSERYSNQDTMREQGAAYIGTGTRIMPTAAAVMILPPARVPAKVIPCASAMASNISTHAATILCSR
jgi:uncharacterized protein YcgI (DUF1989 family)